MLESWVWICYEVITETQVLVVRDAKHLPGCLPARAGQAVLFLPAPRPALLHVCPRGAGTLSGLLCKGGDDVFMSPDGLSIGDSQSLLKLCVFLGRP